MQIEIWRHRLKKFKIAQIIVGGGGDMKGWGEEGRGRVEDNSSLSSHASFKDLDNPYTESKFEHVVDTMSTHAFQQFLCCLISYRR